jgi:plasmid maintenance system antidote protein VapI
MSVYRKPIEKIMTQLQLNTNDLAKYFVVSRSHMSKLILGTRSFGGMSIYYLGQLAQLAGTTTENKDIIQSLKSTSAQNLQEELQRRNKELDELIAKLTIKLAVMESAYDVSLHSSTPEMY